MTVTINLTDLLATLSFAGVVFLLWQKWSFYNSNTGTLLRLYQRYEKFAWQNKEFYLSVWQTVFGVNAFDSLASKEANVLEALKNSSSKEGILEIAELLKSVKAKADAKSTDESAK